MTAAENGRTHSFTSVRLAIVGLVMVSVAGCHERREKVAANGGDTPIVISGGSIHFRATKKSNWTPCNGGSPTPTTTCYEAPFANKADLVNYQFVNEDFVENAVPITSSPKVSNAWEIDVVDANPDGQHMVLVCAESSATSGYASCDHGPITTQNIYVIVKGNGATFDEPKGPGNSTNRLQYHDGDNRYDYIANISLNASGGAGGQQTACTDNACDLFLSK